MIYNLANELDKRRFQTRAQSLADRGRVVELVEKTSRTTSQNAYLHLIVGVVAMETGNTIEDTKRWYFKEICNPQIFCVQHTDRMGNTFHALRSTADLTKEETSTAIDRFKRWAAENGIYIPDPEDQARLRDIEIEMGRNAAYL